MGLLECADCLTDQIVSANEFNFELLHNFQCPGVSQKRAATLEGAELTLSTTLPGARIIITDTTCANIEERLLGFLEVRFWNEITNFVHENPLQTGYFLYRLIA